MKKYNAFTLIEILVVATIVGLLTMVGLTSYSQLGKNSRDARRKADIEQVRAALEMYKSNSDNSSYPATFDAMITEYIKANPVDPKTGLVYITYAPSPGGCDESTTNPCTSYTVSGELESGGIYQTDPYGGTVLTGTTAPTSTSVPPSPTNTPTNTPTPTESCIKPGWNCTIDGCIQVTCGTYPDSLTCESNCGI